MDQTTPMDSRQHVIDMRPHAFVQVVILGVGLGLAAWLLSLAIDQLVVRAIVCGGQACAASTEIAGNVALVLASIGGLFGLIRLGVYRPLLVVLASAIVLWSLSALTMQLVWYEALAWTVLLYGAVYAAFTWLVRPRFFIIAIILVVILAVASRLIA